MAMVTMGGDDPRTLKAAELAARASSWLKCRTRGGVQAFGIPSHSTPGRFHIVTVDRCDCQNAQRRTSQPCKHVLAVRLHLGLSSDIPVQPRTSAFVAVGTNDRGETVYLPRREPDAIATESDAAFWRRFED